jgi:hypothetical protein
MKTPHDFPAPTSILPHVQYSACAIAAGWLLLLHTALGCRPELPMPSGLTGGSGAAKRGMELEIEPPAPLDAAPRVLRLRITLEAIPDASASDVVLVSGEVSDAHLRQLARDDVSKALSERLIPVIAWTDETAADAVRIILAPTIELAEGETYAVASGKAFEAIHFHVAAPDPVPVLSRIWPPVDEAATAHWGLWCGMQSLPAVDVSARLAPAGPEGMLKRGIIEGGGGMRCVRFEATAGMAEDPQPRVGPPALFFPESAGILARLDPRPFVLDTDPPATESARCHTDELAFGPGCALVADDRLYGRSPETPWLWAVTGTGIDEVFTTDAGDPFVLKGLSPLSMNSLDVAAIDARAEALRTIFMAATLEPMPHVVLSEVQANPLGPEPGQEWVEIMNDGSVGTNLGGYVLADIGGETVLPDAWLPPSGYVLIVNETFVEDDELDVPPAAGTLLLRVSKLGLNGLSNSGEPLKLLDPEGKVVSRFPATPKPKAGRSVSRVKPDAPDGISASFADSEPTPGLPNIH